MSWTDNELRKMALNQWANHIETGHMGLSLRDVQEQVASMGAKNFEALHGRGVPVSGKPLSDEQRVLVARIRKLAEEEMQTKLPAATR